MFKKLKIQNTIHCDSEKSVFLNDWNFSSSYDWMAEQMKRRIGNPPVGVKYPIWAWHSFDGKHQKPDLRRMEFRTYKGDQVCLELEIPDKNVLLSDEVMWNMILNGFYIANCEDEKDIDAEERWFDMLPKKQQKMVKEKSWEKIFDVFERNHDCSWNSQGLYIQATFWELCLENVVNVRYFKGRL